MKALVKNKSEKGLWLVDVEKPKPKANEVLIKVKKASVCGTDLHIYEWDEWARNDVKVPVTVGHEFMGVVEDLGENVTRFKKSDRVSAEGHIACNHCRNCQRGMKHICIATIAIGRHTNGCFADYIVVPEENVFSLNKSIDDDIGSILDPLGNSTHTALSFELIGEDVLITGAGPVGLFAAAIARHAGARNVFITDVNDYRLNLAREVGATHAINVNKQSITDEMKKAGIEVGFDVILEMSGSPGAFKSIFKLAMLGAKVALLGVPSQEIAIDWNDIVFKGIEIKGIYGREMFETWYKMSTMLQSGLDVKKVITHHFKKEEFEKAFEVMKSGKAGKVVLNWEK